MANSRQIVALNVGSQRVSMGVFSKTSKDARYATRLVVLDPSAEGLRLTKIGEAIADLVQELNVKGSVVNYSVSGQSVFIRFVKLPALDDTDVEQLIRFEAQQHVPFPLDEVVWDYHLLPAKGLEREAILVAIKAEDLDSLNDEIVSHGLSTGKVDCALTSLYNAYVDSYPDEKEPVMLIDIGAKSTDLIYSEQGRFFTRSISAGGIFVTSAIAREFNISFMEAERPVPSLSSRKEPDVKTGEEYGSLISVFRAAMAASRRKTGSLIMVALITEPLYPFREGLFCSVVTGKAKSSFNSCFSSPSCSPVCTLRREEKSSPSREARSKFFPVKVHAW